MNGYYDMRFDFYTPSEVTQILGERLKKRRLILNLTQSTLAERAGVGISTVVRIESGQGGTLDNMVRMAIGLGLINEFAELFDIAPANIKEVMEQKNLRQRASTKTS
jgi:transcriptional regulator with XRE-family HTH domain